MLLVVIQFHIFPSVSRTLSSRSFNWLNPSAACHTVNVSEHLHMYDTLKISLFQSMPSFPTNNDGVIDRYKWKPISFSRSERTTAWIWDGQMQT